MFGTSLPRVRDESAAASPATVLVVDGGVELLLATLDSRWCRCEDAPWFARAPLTILDHAWSCGFPATPCSVREHRVVRHKGCGREMPLRFCGCGATGFTLDPARDRWVHYGCGWPTRAWFAACGSLPKDDLLGLKPVTYHEFVVTPKSPKKTYARLTEAQQRLNDEYAGRWIRD